jgi:two-component sensor histidine kinase
MTWVSAFAAIPPDRRLLRLAIPYRRRIFGEVTGVVQLVADKASSSVYISHALASRSAGRTDAHAEKRALHSLAATMAERPAALLPQFVEQAMILTGGVSAGLSLYEPEPAPGVFRWRCLQGLLAPFENATTPRDDSPCGVTLDRNAATLSNHPERIYDWIAAENLVIPEVLLVPLYIGGGREPLGTLWIVAEEEGHFHRGHAETAAELASFAGIALGMIREEERLRASLDEQELLAKEMSHRLKNLFAMTDGMIHGSARNADNVTEMATALSGRLHALAKAHALVQRRASAVGSEKVSDLGELITAIVEPHGIATAGGGRIAVDGPRFPCGEHATNAVALMVHELATNAAKYGALASPNGRVEISWRLERGRLALRWRESGGPEVAGKPARTGFGTSLVGRTVERQLLGSIDYKWARAGLDVAILIDADRLKR